MQSRWLPCICWIALLALVCLPASEGGQPGGMTDNPAASTLIGTFWTAEDIGGRGIVDQVESTLSFESEERAAGSSGCNRYLAPLQLSGTSLRFGMASTTRRACPPAVMDQERRFLTALAAARSYRRDGGTLWLLDEAGQTVIRLTQHAGATAPRVPSEAAVPPTTLAAYAFDCTDGPGFVLRMVDRDTADLVLSDSTRRLAQQPSASGVRYSDGETTVWNKGREAILERAGRTYQCVENRARSVREDARARGAQVWGTGQEPGWVMEILTDQLVFISGDGAEHVVVPHPTVTVDPAHSVTIYTASSEAHRLRVRLQEHVCTDSMSGERFDLRVEVEVDGLRYRGCGLRFR